MWVRWLLTSATFLFATTNALANGGVVGNRCSIVVTGSNVNVSDIEIDCGTQLAQVSDQISQKVGSSPFSAEVENWKVDVSFIEFNQDDALLTVILDLSNNFARARRMGVPHHRKLQHPLNGELGIRFITGSGAELPLYETSISTCQSISKFNDAYANCHRLQPGIDFRPRDSIRVVLEFEGYGLEAVDSFELTLPIEYGFVKDEQIGHQINSWRGYARIVSVVVKGVLRSR